jgi:hypothetical protein
MAIQVGSSNPRLDVDSVTGDPTQKTWAKANIEFAAGLVRRLAVGLASP